MNFSSNLKDLLEIKNIQLKELSAGTGISKNTLDNYLSGQKSIPNAENAVKIAAYLNTSVEYLIAGESAPADYLRPIVNDLRKLKQDDLESIKQIIHSLASK